MKIQPLQKLNEIKYLKEKKANVIQQMLRYAEAEVIQKTIKQLKHFSGIRRKEPETLILVSPEGGKEQEIIKELNKEQMDMNFGFISLNKMFEISEFYFKLKKSERSTFLLKKLR